VQAIHQSAHGSARNLLEKKESHVIDYFPDGNLFRRTFT
jgi:hypothetical protein